MSNQDCKNLRSIWDMSVVIDALHQHIPKDGKLLVACSGGLDSTVLLAALVEAGYSVQALHVNYQLRGEASEGDATFITQLCTEKQVPLTVVRCPKTRTKGKGINLQSAARDFRHNAFRKWIERGEKYYVVLAHHRDDQLETFFLQLGRGAGIFGLGGMHVSKNGLIRPFLELTKADLHAFAKEKQITWREDSSNSTLDYARNRLRNEILPELTSINPSLEESILYMQSIFRQEQMGIEENIKSTVEQMFLEEMCTFENWDLHTLEEKIAIGKHFGWSALTIDRIESLKNASLSAKIDKTGIFKLKNGFSWVLEFPLKKHWDFKSNRVEILPTSFSLSQIYLDANLFQSEPIVSVASSEDRMSKLNTKGSAQVYKILKDAGVPEQWRNSYPVLKIDNEVVWIPEIALSAKYLATEKSTNILEYRLK